MQVKHLDHLNLSVSDFGATLDWYRRVFGFALVEEGVRSGTHWGIIRAGDALLCIYEHKDYEMVDADEQAARHMHHINHFGLRITDQAKWEKIIAQEKVQVLYGGAVSYPHSLSWYVVDPTGYEIEVALWNDDLVRFDDSEKLAA